MELKCPNCKSPNLCYNINKNRIGNIDDLTHLRIPGHCPDCGHSFTVIYELHPVEIIDRR